MLKQFNKKKKQKKKLVRKLYTIAAEYCIPNTLKKTYKKRNFDTLYCWMGVADFA